MFPMKIIKTVEEIFKNVVSKPKIKTLALIAISTLLAKIFKINEISRLIPKVQVRINKLRYHQWANLASVHNASPQ